MLTLEKAKELFGELPKDVLEDSYAQEQFLDIYSLYLRDEENYGQEYCKKNRVSLISAWDLIRTYI